jgi:hypothetical protein
MKTALICGTQKSSIQRVNSSSETAVRNDRAKYQYSLITITKQEIKVI